MVCGCFQNKFAVLAFLQKCDFLIHQRSSSAMWLHLGVSPSVGSWIANNLFSLSFPGGASGKEPGCQCRRCKPRSLIPGLGRSPGGGHGNPPVFLPGESHGQRSRTGYSPWGQKELDTTEQLTQASGYLPMLCE